MFGGKPKLALDAKRPNRAKRVFSRTKSVESRLGIQLRRLAGHISDLIAGFDVTNPDPVVASEIERQLEAYSKILEPWARSVSLRMIAEVNSRDWKAWQIVSRQIGRGVVELLKDAPVGTVVQQLLSEQTRLITSIPYEAAVRVRELTMAGISGGVRPGDYVDEIMRLGEVSKSRATLIARTEVARTASVLSQVRAQHIGSTHFIWRTSKDSDVRDSHRKLEGQVFAWDDPPVSDPPNYRSLPGQIWNCRCTAEAIFPESLWE